MNNNDMRLLRWLLYLSVFVLVGALILPLLGPGTSVEETIKVAIPVGGFVFVLYGFLVSRGALKLWVPSLRFIVGAVGILIMIGAAVLAALIELPIQEARDSQDFVAKETPILQAKLQQPISAKEREQIQGTLDHWEENKGDALTRIEGFRSDQRIAGFVSAAGFVVLLLSRFLPRRRQAEDSDADDGSDASLQGGHPDD